MQALNIIFPAQILRGAGVINRLGEVCAALGKRALVIGGHAGLAAVDTQIRHQLAASAVELVGLEWFGGECTEENIQRLAHQVEVTGADLVIGVGGGKRLIPVKPLRYRDMCRLSPFPPLRQPVRP
jgi:glycerol dehydrogenase